MESPISEATRARIRAVRLFAFDFDGVFTDNTVYVSQDGTESVRCWRGDGLGLRKLERLGIELVILSTEKNPVVKHRAAKLGLACQHGLDDKLQALQALASERGYALTETAYMGNDINDRECLSSVGLPVVVADAHPDVLGLGLLRTKALGGRGAVREICDLFEDLRR